MNIKDNIEKALSDTSINTSATIAGAGMGAEIGGTEGAVLGAILTSFANLPVVKNFNKNIENELNNIHEILYRQKIQLNEMTEAQYKIIRETISTILRTEQKKKLTYLRLIIENSLNKKDIASQEATLISRIIRDITVEEVEFMLTNNHYNRIFLAPKEDEEKPDESGFIPASISSTLEENTLTINMACDDANIVHGLSNIGILIPAEMKFGGQNYQFSKITDEVVTLLKDE